MLIQKVAGLAAITHIAFFPMLEANWQERMRTDPFFSIRAYEMGYYSSIMCSPSDADKRPHSPYHHSTPACHAFTAGGSKAKRFAPTTGCCDGSSDGDLSMNGIPAHGSDLHKRRGQNWDAIITREATRNPDRFVPRAKTTRRLG